MEIEYSQEVKGLVFAYRFDGFEQQAIAQGLRTIIKKTEKKIERIRNNPKNEGQATYQSQIGELSYEIKALSEIVLQFEN